MRVNREDLLRALQSAQPGLSPKEIQEQTNCFVFQKGMVKTYNDEVACAVPTTLEKKFTGAVPAEPLLAVLSKLSEEELTLSAADGQLLVQGKRRKFGIRMQTEILLALQNVDDPADWKPLHDDFGDGLAVVQEAAGEDAGKFVLTCVHVHPKWIEACDGFRVIRHKMRTGFTDRCLIRKESIKHVVGAGMTEFSETPAWVHFRNPSGVVFSVRRWLEEFPDLTAFLKVSGDKTNIPSTLGEDVELAQIFSDKNAEDKLVTVHLRPGRVVLEGRGPDGWARLPRKVSYAGRELKFMIGPKVLAHLSEKHNACEVTEDKLKVDGGKWVYVTVLSRVNEAPVSEAEMKGEES